MPKSVKPIYRPVWLEINLSNLAYNLGLIRKKIAPKTAIVAMVKQNAYGHGLIPSAKVFIKEGAHFLGVASLEEAVKLREAGIKTPILVLSAVPKKYASVFVRYRIIPVIADFDFAFSLNKAAGTKPFPVHVKVDTGMGRLGQWHKEAFGLFYQLRKLTFLKIEGILTHFPVADTDKEFTNKQVSDFNRLIKSLQKEGFKFKYIHCANSAAIFKHSNSYFNMVRPGLSLYGVSPFANIKLPLKPALSFKTRIIFIKDVPAGCGISYGRTFIAKKKMRIGVLAVGYADGYPWRLSNKAEVIIKGKLCPIVGRVCMDHTMVDLSSVKEVEVGEEAVLIGKSKNSAITAAYLAKLAGTISYEILTGLSCHLPRVYYR